jgi:hypothetical protein
MKKQSSKLIIARLKVSEKVPAIERMVTTSIARRHCHR